MRRCVLSRALALTAVAVLGAGCTAVAGVSGYAVDPCFDGCADDAALADARPEADAARRPEAGADAMPLDASRDAPLDAPRDAGPEADAGFDAGPPSPGTTDVVVAGTGVVVGGTAVATLTTRDEAGLPVPRLGAGVTFTASSGSGASVVSFGAVDDRGDGTYRVLVTGLTEGTPIDVSAVLDGAPLTTPPARLRVVDPPGAGLTLSLDAADADRAGNFGGRHCLGAGLRQWFDLTPAAFTGVLLGFDDPCAPASGWSGTGAPENPFRLAFDGIDDHVYFGAVNPLERYTIIAWVRRTGSGFPGITSPAGYGGLSGATRVVPIVTKGTAEAEADRVDVAYYLGIVATGQLGSDYETRPGSGNAGLVGATVLDLNRWYMVATTVDATAGSRALWVDGAVDATALASLPPAGAASSVLTVGGAKRSTDGISGTTCPGSPGSTGCARFQGDIAAVLTYDHALSPAEIERTCHAMSSRFGMMTCPN